MASVRRGSESGKRDKSGAIKYDDSKPRYDLIPPRPMEALAIHFGRGAAKYGDRNWEAGMGWGRLFRAAMTHAWLYWRGEENDKDTGTHHLICAVWNLLCLYEYTLTRKGKDDRP